MTNSNSKLEAEKKKKKTSTIKDEAMRFSCMIHQTHEKAKR